MGNIKKEVIMPVQNNNHHVSFSGLKINTCLNTNNLEKLNTFLSEKKNVGLISELEKDFQTDVVIYKDPSILNLEHRKYGNITNYGAKPIEAEVFWERAAEIKENLDKAIKKAKITWDKILEQTRLN